MKKIICLLIALTIIAGLTACSGQTAAKVKQVVSASDVQEISEKDTMQITGNTIGIVGNGALVVSLQGQDYSVSCDCYLKPEYSDQAAQFEMMELVKVKGTVTEIRDFSEDYQNCIYITMYDCELVD